MKTYVIAVTPTPELRKLYTIYAEYLKMGLAKDARREYETKMGAIRWTLKSRGEEL